MPTTAVPASEREEKPARPQASRRNHLREDEEASAGLMAGVAGAFGLIIIIIGAVIGMRVIASMAPGYIESVANVTSTVQNSDFGNDDVNDMRAPIAILMAFAGLFAIVGLVLAVMVIKRGRGASP